MKKLYEYVIDNQLNYQFIKRISINEQTKTVWFELIVLHNGNEYSLISSKKEITFEEINQKIKYILFEEIAVEVVKLICDLNLCCKNEDVFKQIRNGFKVNGKEILLEGNKYTELKEKILNEVKQYGLH